MVITDTVNEQMYEYILSLIQERRILPGEKINLKQIAEENNVSAMPVRNALQMLSAEGLVETRQRVGIFVKQYTNQELRQIYELRRVYEIHCLEQFSESIPEQIVKSLYEQIEKTDPLDNKMIALDEQLHSMIVEASQNVFLIRQYNTMMNLFRIYMFRFSTNEELAKEEHLLILRAIRMHNQTFAMEMLKQHLNRSMSAYVGGENL